MSLEVIYMFKFVKSIYVCFKFRLINQTTSPNTCYNIYPKAFKNLSTKFKFFEVYFLAKFEFIAADVR